MKQTYEIKRGKVLVEIINNSRAKECILETKKTSCGNLFLFIQTTQHDHFIGNFLELGFVFKNKPLIKCGMVNQVYDEGILVELFDLEKITL